jgi:2-polyprenyl-6-methoxyphenol hydroxylase-like FAD-dependent oxidoreductase
MGNRPLPLTNLVDAEQTGPPVWTSTFHVPHRIAGTLAKGHVYLAGDAAHVHSPIGARGMNLGLEDAWVFAELVRTNRLREYDWLRRPVDRRTVHQVEFLSRIAAADSRVYGFLRTFVFPAAIRMPFVRARMAATVTGQDHGLPDLAERRH